MNLLELGCYCLTIPRLKEFMDLAGYPGKGIFAALLGVAVWGYGYYRADLRAKRLGYAILLSLSIVAALTMLLKFGLQLPRPTPRSGYGFPSGDSATAFSVAAAAGAAYPMAAPTLYSIAFVTALARLYFRAHFVWDVVGGALLGSACGYWSARKLIPLRERWRRSALWLVAWIPGAALALVALSFFWLLEQEIARHKVSHSSPPVRTTEALRVDFGTPSAQAHLLTGWTSSRIWPAKGIAFNWVEGLQASISLKLPEPRDLRMIIRAYPYRPQGFVCQRAFVTVNGALSGRFFFEQDWQSYTLKVPRDLLRPADNRIDFAFAYADNTNWHGVNPERKALSIAFQTLRLVAE
ncbi:MAG: phosphatase PAP2 family protein [Candidatus Binatia bacterium]